MRENAGVKRRAWQSYE